MELEQRRPVTPDAEYRTPPGSGRAPDSGWSAVAAVWSTPSRWIGILAAVAPSVVLVVVAAATELGWALLAAGVTSLIVLALRLRRREPLRAALVGVLVVAACAVVAAVTGEARGFFLLPTLVPFVVIAVCLGSLVARRPLTGLILNRITGGPADWPRHRRLLRVHDRATTAAIAINAVNGALQVIFYSRSDTAVLAVAHAATGPLFATLVAVTVVSARKAMR
ncbi:uncharacterized protein DUF3159 [Motilibacter peucedani]|uniref:Uncharacterized protein DUF3159 n=1 Tax=Motilibacter peucedani TaxID=598650 RepID=A0A420XSU4_9ACTN|nr:DUF3159 domain-containing protein [Motilibacter peucedani]RKS79915.1 uncharacterized protein DUF3159 [Motilibacter peucedani]